MREQKPKAKPWASVASVTRNHLTREVTAKDPAVPSALTPEMRREAEAQTVEPSNPKHIETFEPIRLSEENLKRGGWQR